MNGSFEIRSNIFVFKGEEDPLSPLVERQGSYDAYDLFARVYKNRELGKDEILHRKVIRAFFERICGLVEKTDKLLNKNFSYF